MRHYFEEYTEEGNRFLNKLESNLGTPGERAQTFTLLRAVFHTLRDRVPIPENLNIMSQLPMALKGVYVDQWKYSNEPEKYDTIEEFLGKVEQYQKQFGEKDFDWNMSTREIVTIFLSTIREEYWSEGEWNDISENFPADLKKFFREEIAQHA